jgi:hypothetical protein
MKEWTRKVNQNSFFSQDFTQGEIIAVDSYFYPDDVTYYASEKGLTIERITKVPKEYEGTKSKWNFFTIIHTRFQLPTLAKKKPIEVPLSEIF